MKRKFVRGQCFPLVIALMSRRTTESYKSVFEYINKNILKLNGSTCISDFERALRNALEEIAPDITLLGCWFHHFQALRKKLASDFELFSLVRSNDDAKILFRKFQCLALLPPELIQPAFHQLAFRALKAFPQFARFIGYYDMQWMNRETPASFSVFS